MYTFNSLDSSSLSPGLSPDFFSIKPPRSFLPYNIRTSNTAKYVATVLKNVLEGYIELNFRYTHSKVLLYNCYIA